MAYFILVATLPRSTHDWTLPSERVPAMALTGPSEHSDTVTVNLCTNSHKNTTHTHTHNSHHLHANVCDIYGRGVSSSI